MNKWNHVKTWDGEKFVDSWGVDPSEPYVEPKRVRRRGVLTIKNHSDDGQCKKVFGLVGSKSVSAIETFADDPDFDELIDVATKLIRAASIGDQYFIPALKGNDPETTKVRHLLVDLADVLRGEIDDEPRSEK